MDAYFHRQFPPDNTIRHCGQLVIIEEGCWRCGDCGRLGCDKPEDTDFQKAVKEVEKATSGTKN